MKSHKLLNAKRRKDDKMTNDTYNDLKPIVKYNTRNAYYEKKCINALTLYEILGFPRMMCRYNKPICFGSHCEDYQEKPKEYIQLTLF